MKTKYAVYQSCQTPLGKLFLAAEKSGLVLSSYRNAEENLEELNARGYLPTRSSAKSADDKAKKILSESIKKITQYFKGDLNALKTLKVAPQGTDFQKDIWNALRHIKPGETLSYSELAETIGRPAAIRAAGTACKANPLVLVVPCHRVIGKNNSLTGFNAGLERKEYLLSHEGLEFS